MSVQLSDLDGKKDQKYVMESVIKPEDFIKHTMTAPLNVIKGAGLLSKYFGET